MITKAHFNFNLALTVIFIGSFLLAIGSNYYKYLYAKNYKFVVEQSCNPAAEQCFFRDCEKNPDSCPPNGLSHYKKAYVKAANFPRCSDNSCQAECDAKQFTCKPIACDAANGDECEGPQAQ